MIITIERYRILMFIAMASFVSTSVAWFIRDLPFSETLLALPLVFVSLYGALVVLTNIKRGGIRAYWRKEDKVLTIPFQNGPPIIAHDENGIEYEIGFLMIPREIK